MSATPFGVRGWSPPSSFFWDLSYCGGKRLRLLVARSSRVKDPLRGSLRLRLRRFPSSLRSNPKKRALWSPSPRIRHRPSSRRPQAKKVRVPWLPLPPVRLSLFASLKGRRQFLGTSLRVPAGGFHGNSPSAPFAYRTWVETPPGPRRPDTPAGFRPLS